MLLVLSFLPKFFIFPRCVFTNLLTYQYCLLRFVFSISLTGFSSLPLISLRFAILPHVSSEIHSFLQVFLLQSISSLASKKGGFNFMPLLYGALVVILGQLYYLFISFSILLRTILLFSLSVLNFCLSAMSLTLSAAILSWTIPISSRWPIAISAPLKARTSNGDILHFNGLLCGLFHFALFDREIPTWLYKFIYGERVWHRWLSCCSSLARRNFHCSNSWSLTRVFPQCVQNFCCLHTLWHLGHPWS